VVDVHRRRHRRHLGGQVEQWRVGALGFGGVDDLLELVAVEIPPTDDPIEAVVGEQRRHCRRGDGQQM
jgi:hypothetical protein